MLQGGLGLHEPGQGELAGLEAFLQDADRLTDLGHLALKTVGKESEILILLDDSLILLIQDLGIFYFAYTSFNLS